MKEKNQLNLTPKKGEECVADWIRATASARGETTWDVNFTYLRESKSFMNAINKYGGSEIKKVIEKYKNK